MSVRSFLNRWATNAIGYLPISRYGGKAHTLTAITAVNIAGDTIGTAGAAGDTVLCKVLIPLHATTATTVILTGFVQDENGSPFTITLTGSTTADTVYDFDQLLNYAAAAQVQASVADVVVIWHGYP